MQRQTGFLNSTSIRVLAALLAISQPARGVAATLLVSNTNDSGAGSLRQAIADNTTLGAGNTIVFSNTVSGTITLASQLIISQDVTILGPGAQLLTISGNHATRVFLITSGNVAISGLTVANGKDALQGNGIEQPAGSLTLSNCVIMNCTNSVTEGGGIYSGTSAGLSLIGCSIHNNSGFNGGGLVINGGNAIILNSTICSNTATGSFMSGSGGGGIHFRGGTLNISNSTIVANACSSSGFGGGILTGTTGTLNLSSCTVASNACASGNGGGVQNNIGAAGFFIMNTIVTANLTLPNRTPDCGGTFSSGGFNLIGKTNGSSGWSTALQDQFGDNTSPLDAKLGPLQSNGGPSPTMALLPHSPAIDQGNSFGLTNDQRGAPRPFKLASLTNAPGGDGSDVGAFEFGNPSLNIHRASSDTIVLSWPSCYGEFELESTDAVPASNNWSAVTNTPVVVGNQFTVTNAALDTSKFYRLKGF